jgi:hypothetical protein
MINLLKFWLKNLLNKKLSFLLLTIFLSIWFWFLFFISISQNYTKSLVKDYFWTNHIKNKIIVQKSDKTFWSLLNIMWNENNNEITQEDIDKISKIQWVEHIYKTSFFKKPSLMNIDLLWKHLETDVFFMWIDSDMISEIIPWFKNNSEYIPLLVSDKAYSSIIEVFAPKWWVTDIWKDLLKNTPLDITFWKSLLFNSSSDSIEKTWKIIWFSDDVSLVFIGMPLDTLQEINKKLTWNDLWIDKLYISYKAWFDSEVIQSQINSLWFQTSFSDDTLNHIESLVNVFYMVISLIIYFFTWVIFYSVISFILLIIEESKKDNSIMFSLWIDKKLIVFIFFLQWFIISCLGLLFSILFVYSIISYINNYFTFYNSNHFLLNFPQIFIWFNDLLSLSVGFILLNILFLLITYYKIYTTKYEKML